MALDRSGVRPTAEPDWRPQALARRLSNEQLNQLVADYRSGDGRTLLSRRYGISENGALAQLKPVGVELRPPGKVAQEDVEEMRRLRQDGWTYTAIGDRFGVTRSAVKLRLDHA